MTFANILGRGTAWAVVCLMLLGAGLPQSSVSVFTTPVLANDEGGEGGDDRGGPDESRLIPLTMGYNEFLGELNRRSTRQAREWAKTILDTLDGRDVVIDGFSRPISLRLVEMAGLFPVETEQLLRRLRNATTTEEKEEILDAAIEEATETEFARYRSYRENIGNVDPEDTERSRMRWQEAVRYFRGLSELRRWIANEGNPQSEAGEE